MNNDWNFVMYNKGNHLGPPNNQVNWGYIGWNSIFYYTRCFFLSDIFETLITPSILKIIDFCKKVMKNKIGQFDNCINRFLYVHY